MTVKIVDLKKWNKIPSIPMVYYYGTAEQAIAYCRSKGHVPKTVYVSKPYVYVDVKGGV